MDDIVLTPIGVVRTPFADHAGMPIQTVAAAGVRVPKTYNFLGITHTTVRVSLAYIVIDSWDNENARVLVDTVAVYNSSFNAGGGDTCGGGFGDRGIQQVTATPGHTANTAVLTVTSTLDQGAGDESFAVDNVSIMIR